VIEIQVEDAPELSRTFRVSADGVIIMPFLGHLTAKDKTAQELADAITGGLRGQYLNEPMVRVTVNQINSCTFFIQGAVRRPGLYQIEGQTTLLKLITVAGGLNENHGSTAFIIRQLNADTRGKQSIGDSEGERHLKQVESEPDGAESSNATPKYDLMKVNINSLLKGSFDQNAVVEPTDIVYIPPADIFFVAGEVNAPGSFPLREGTTLRQAITLAQGMTFRAAAGRGTIFREDPKTSNRQEIKVDINAVMNGKSPDIAVQPDDIIIVPNSRAKSVTDTILKAFGVNAWRFPRAY
jgi:polysaccharide export outer membrane protein